MNLNRYLFNRSTLTVYAVSPKFLTIAFGWALDAQPNLMSRFIPER